MEADERDREIMEAERQVGKLLRGRKKKWDVNIPLAKQGIDKNLAIRALPKMCAGAQFTGQMH